MPKASTKNRYVTLAEFSMNRIPELLNVYYCGYPENLIRFYLPPKNIFLKLFGDIWGEKIAEIDQYDPKITVYNQDWLASFNDLAEQYEKYSNSTIKITIVNYSFHPDPKGYVEDFDSPM
jgi:hypothetical protein